MSLGLTVHFAEAPYLGLRPFEVDEADIFFGREKQTDELLRRLSQTYFLPIVGPSGCGKSSLVRAGLLASLESGFVVEAGGRWRTVAMTPRDRPIEELANAILGCLSDSEESKLIALQSVLRSGPRGLIEALKEISTVLGENLLLLVDQFEEIFRFRDQLAPPDLVSGATSQDQLRKDEADAFVRLLLETVKEKKAYVVLTMRSDFLRDCSLFAGLPEAFNKSIYLTPRLDRDDLQSAIEEPARVLGGSLRPELVRQLINDAGSNQDQLPLMQHVLMRMWSDVLKKRPNRPPELTLEDYANVGELSKALCKDADYAYEKELTTDQQKIAEVMFKSLCVRGSSERDTRAPVRVDRVAKLAGLECAAVVPVVEVFRGEGRYFLRPHTGPLAPDTVLDITHESLIRNWTRLNKWVEEEALSAETYQRLVRDAVEWKNRRGDLLRPIGLSSVIAWKEHAKPTDSWAERYGGQFALAMEFLDASLAQQVIEVQEAARVQRQLFLKENRIKVLGTALVIALGLVSLAVYQTFSAFKQERIAQNNMREANDNFGSALAIKAQLEWRSQKLLSAWPYAVASLAKNQNLEFGPMPLRPAIHYYRQVRHAAKVNALAISPDGKLLAAALSNGSIDLVDPQTGTLVRNFAASPATKNADTKSSAASEDASAGKRQTAQLAFSPDGKLLYCVRRESGLEIRTLPEGELQPPPACAADKKITSFAIDRAGGLALGCDDGIPIFSGAGLSNLLVMPLTQSEIKAPSSQSLRPTGKSLGGNIKDVVQNRRAGTRSPAISFLAFAPDGKTLAGVSGRSLCVWQVEDAQVRELKVGSYSQNSEPTPPPHLNAVLFNPSGNDQLMLASEGGKIDLATLSDAEANSPSSIRGDAAAADDRQTQSVRQAAPQPSEHPPERTLKVEIENSFTPQKTDDLVLPRTSPSNQRNKLGNDDGKVVGATDPSGENFYWVTSDGRLTAWWPETLNSGNETEWQYETSRLFVKAHKGAATAVAVSPSGSWLATGGDDQTTRIWRINTVESLARAAKATLPPIAAVAVNPRGKVVAIGSDRFGTRILRDDAIQLFPGLEPEETTQWLSDDGKSVLVSSPKTVRIFDTATFQQRALVEGARFDSEELPFAFNGAILAALESDDDTELYVALWDAETGKKLGHIPAANDKIMDLMFGSAGRNLLAIATDKNRLSLWDIHDPAHPSVAKDMSTGEADIVFISFAPAENVVAAATSDKVVLFDAKTGEQLPAIPVPESPIAMTFNAKGTLLAIAFKNDLVKVWDCEKSEERTEIRGPEGFSKALAISSGNEIVTGGSDGVVRVWDLTGQLVKSFGGSDWRPKTVEDAARLSGLMRKDLDVRFLTPEEEKNFGIDAAVPLEEGESLADYWRTALATTRNFTMLEAQLDKQLEEQPKAQPELRPEEVKKKDLLAGWLSSHQQSSADRGTQVRAQVATDRHKTLLLNLATKLAEPGIEAFWNGDPRRAVDIFNTVLAIIPVDAYVNLLALRGFARHCTGDEPGATKDRESWLKTAPKVNIREWDVPLRQSELTSEQLLLDGQLLTWLNPDYRNGHRYQAEANYALKQYDAALTEVNEAIKLQRANDAARAADGAVTPAMASLLLLRGRVLEAQRSPEARKNFQQVVDGLTAAGIDNETKAFAQLHLGKFDPKYFDEAERFFRGQTTTYPDRSLTYYNLACFFAVRSASYSGTDKHALSKKDVTAAIDALRTGANLPEHDSLQRFVDTTAELFPLKNNPRFTALLKEEEAPSAGDSE